MADLRRIGRPWARSILYGFTAVVLVFVVVIPYARLFQEALEVRWNPGGLVVRAAWNTVWSSVAVTMLALLVGAAAALVTERTAVRGRRWLRIGMVLPLFIPPFAAALSWMRTYGPGGLLSKLVGLEFPGLVGPVGVVAVMTVHAAPLAYVVVAAGLAVRVEPDLERAARASGAGPVQTLRTVTLPLLRPTLLGAAGLVFISSANSFGIPAVLGIPTGFHTITTRIYQDFAFSAEPAAFARAVGLAAGLAVGAVTVVTMVDRIVGVGSTTRTASPQGSPTIRYRGWALPVLLWSYLAFTSVVPLAGLLLSALTKAVGLQPTLSNLTLANVREALSGRFVAALGRSVVLAVVAATVVMALAALMTALRQGRVGRVMRTMSAATFAVPGSALAVAMLLAYGRLLRDTLGLILLAYVSKFWALGHRSTEGSIESIPPDLLRAARTSGAGPVTSLRLVTVPLLRPALFAGWSLVFLFGIHELTMSSLLYGPGTDTVAVVVLNLQQLGDVTVTSALATVLTFPVLAGSLLVLGRRVPSARLVGTE